MIYSHTLTGDGRISLRISGCPVGINVGADCDIGHLWIDSILGAIV